MTGIAVIIYPELAGIGIFKDVLVLRMKTLTAAGKRSPLR